jgi:hypothetical protein
MRALGIEIGCSRSSTKAATFRTPKPDDSLVTFAEGVSIGNLVHKVETVTVPVKENNEEALWTMFVAKADVAGSIQLLDDLIVVCEYSVTPQPS